MIHYDLTKQDENISEEIRLLRGALEDLTSLVTGLILKEGAEV